MKQINSIEDLIRAKEEAQRKTAERDRKIQVKVHMGTCGVASGANEIWDVFSREIEARRLHGIILSRVGCIGLCGHEPTVTVIHPEKGKAIYVDVTVDKVPKIMEQHIIGGNVIKEWVMEEDEPFFKLQEKRVLANQDVDARDIEEYIARDGYQALAKALTQMKPGEVLEEVGKSGLRGRGGAGFPTGTKWGFVRSAPGDEKFVVCNGDEGDPGAYMDRTVLEGNPYAVIEGMAIGAYAIGNVRQGYAYVRAEYPLAIETLGHAIDQAREYGLLGEGILGTEFEFDLDIFPGAGAFVCGEETALLFSLQGMRGNPRQRPPFPANKGLFEKPTTLNNVETWANIPGILLKGADWFSSVGTETAKGAKTFCLVGKVNNTGLIEVPMGISVGEVIFDIGGGIPNGKKFKSLQIGGPSGGCLSVEHLNVPIDYEHMTGLGAIMGSGGLIVIDEDNCMVDMAKFFLQFTKDESCGKCIPCRVGIPKILETIEKISRGEGKMEDLDTLEELASMVAEVSLCGLGQTAPNPVLSTIRHFREEYEAHIIDKKCPAAVCAAFFRAPCQHACPVGLDCFGYAALIKEGKFDEAYRLIKQKLPFPMVVGRVCHHPCEAKCRRAQVDEPVAIRHLKRFAADWALEHNVEYIPEIKEKREERVAIIGSGPAGLSAAWDLAIYGYQVTVFEALPEAGGMLAVGIPEYRLPKDILKKEVGDVRKLGVEIKQNSRVDDVTSLLKDGYKAIFIAIGAHEGAIMGIPGEDLEGVYEAIKFLREVNLGREVKVGKKVAVIGGGNTAVDSARVALRKGADEVYIFYRREKKDMPAIEEEVLSTEEEGVHLHCLTTPTKILGDNGRVSGLELVRMELREFDRSGRRTPYAIEGSEYKVAVDMVIEAIGQRPDTSLVKDGELKIARGGTIVADPRTLATEQKGIFAGGDAVTGAATVVEAIAAGQRAASSIRRWLQGKGLSPLVERDGYEPIAIPSILPTEEETQEKAKVRISEIEPKERVASFKQAVSGYSPEEAMEEARRCLRCDLGV